MLAVIISKWWDFCFHLCCLSVSSSCPVMNEPISWKNWFGVCGCPWPLPIPWKALNVLLAENKIKTSRESQCLSGEGSSPRESSHSPWSPWRGDPRDAVSCGVGRPRLALAEKLLPFLRTSLRNLLPSALLSTLEPLFWDGKTAWWCQAGRVAEIS